MLITKLDYRFKKKFIYYVIMLCRRVCYCIFYILSAVDFPFFLICLVAIIFDE